MAYEIDGQTVVYTGTVRMDKDSQKHNVRWVFDFSNVEDTTALMRMSVEPSGLVVKAQARWRSGNAKDKQTFDVKADFLDKTKERKSKAEKALSEVEKMTDEEKAEFLRQLQADGQKSTSGQSGKKSGK